MSSAAADSYNANSDNTVFNIKDTKFYVPVVTLSAKDYQKLSKLLSKGFERSVYWNENKKQKMRIKIQQMNVDVFSNFVGANRLSVLIYLNRENDVKRFKTRIYYLSKSIIKNCNVSINGKNFYDQAIDSDIKRYEETRKLTTGQGEDYTTGCLLD